MNPLSDNVTPQSGAILSWLEQREDGMAALLADLVAIRSCECDDTAFCLFRACPAANPYGHEAPTVSGNCPIFLGVYD